MDMNDSSSDYYSDGGGGGGVLSQIPPGFRFHPTEEELLHYYLKKKVNHEIIHLDVIPAIALNKLEPWDIQEKCRIGSSSHHQNEWYFFCHKDKKYPTGSRTNRATAAGFWKATGRDKEIYSNSSGNGFLKRIGMRKTLVFYKGRAPRGQISDWIMHEYRLDKVNVGNCKDEWVICRLFKKRNKHQCHDSSKISSSTALITKMSNNSSSTGEIVRTRNRGDDFERRNYYRAPCTSSCEPRPIDDHREEITDSDQSSIVTVNQNDVNGGCSATALERLFDFLLDGHEEDDTSKQAVWFNENFRENDEMGLWDLIAPSSASQDPQFHAASSSNL